MTLVRSIACPSYRRTYFVSVATLLAVAGSAPACSSSSNGDPSRPVDAGDGTPNGDDASVADASTGDGAVDTDGGCGSCPAPEHGSATCSNGICGFTCAPGFEVKGADCVAVSDWTKQFGTSEGDSAEAVAVDAQRNSFVAGSTDGVLTGQTGAGSRDAFVVKFDASGNVVWTRQFGSNKGDSADAMALDANGNIFVSGYTKGTLPGQAAVQGDGDAYVAKLDAAGNVVWTRQFGSSGWDRARAVAVDTDGRIFAAGDTNDALPGQTHAGHEDPFVTQLDASGNVVWTRQFGSSEIDFANAIGVDASGNVIVAGETDGALLGQTSTGKRDAFVTKLGASGSTVWTRQFGSSSGDNDDAKALTIAADGKIFVAGTANGPMPGQTGPLSIGAYALALDPSGTTVWTRQFGMASARSIAVAADGKAFVAGQVDGTLSGQTNLGGSDAFVVRLSP